MKRWLAALLVCCLPAQATIAEQYAVIMPGTSALTQQFMASLGNALPEDRIIELSVNDAVPEGTDLVITMGRQGLEARLQQPDGRSITGRQALIRLAVAQLSWLCGGLGFLWQLWDGESRSWHDIASGTRLVTLPKGTFKD